MQGPQRIVCLTTETVEVLYLLGEQQRIVGISGYTTRPPIARVEKPKISGFTSAKLDKILALAPDLVLCFSDMQADIAANLVKAGCEVHVFNQRSLAQTLNMIQTVGDMVGASDRARALVTTYQAQCAMAKTSAEQFTRKPRIYFEEWDTPMICGIGWVSELIHLAGGIDCFAALSQAPNAAGRMLSDAHVIAAQPDIIIGSWCGEKFQANAVNARLGWEAIPAIQNAQLYEIKSADILQAGPVLFSEGLAQLQAIIQTWQQSLPHENLSQ